MVERWLYFDTYAEESWVISEARKKNYDGSFWIGLKIFWWWMVMG